MLSGQTKTSYPLLTASHPVSLKCSLCVIPSSSIVVQCLIQLILFLQSTVSKSRKWPLKQLCVWFFLIGKNSPVLDQSLLFCLWLEYIVQTQTSHVRLMLLDLQMSVSVAWINIPLFLFTFYTCAVIRVSLLVDVGMADVIWRLTLICFTTESMTRFVCLV